MISWEKYTHTHDLEAVLSVDQSQCHHQASRAWDFQLTSSADVTSTNFYLLSKPSPSVAVCRQSCSTCCFQPFISPVIGTASRFLIGFHCDADKTPAEQPHQIQQCTLLLLQPRDGKKFAAAVSGQ